MNPSPSARLPRKRRWRRGPPSFVGTNACAGGIRARRPSVRGRRASGGAGFTLVEILVTLGVLVLLASVAWPAMESQIRASELPESADRMRTVLAMTRCEAMVQYRRFRVRFEAEAQQPIVEWEPDPIRRPGEFEATAAPWADEAVLLADVQVHKVELGRPVWTMPIAQTDDPDAVLQDIEEEKEEQAEKETELGFSVDGGLAVSAQDEELAVEETRPMIVFDVDGSSEWATLVVARVDPTEDLAEDDPQIWILLDGRTGLASIRDQVTEEQLSDSEFYVEREKLELPDTVDVDDLSFDVTTSLPGTGDDSLESALGGLTGSDGSSGQQDLSTILVPPSNLQSASGAATGASQSGGQQSQGARPSGGRRPPSGTGKDADSQLNGELAGSDLTDQEKANVRQNFPRGQGTKKK